MDLKKPAKQIWLINFWLLCCLPKVLAFTDSIPSVFDYLERFDSLELVVTTDSKALLRKKDEYQNAQIHFKNGLQEVLSVEGEIRTRGNVRKEICYMPPTKLRFDKAFLKELGYSTYPTLKLVNACSLRDPDEIYVHAEHLVYRLNRLFTPNSFRTIPLQIRYIDSGGKRDDMEFFAFIIEHEDQMADRAGGDIYEGSLFKERSLERSAYLEFCMFQYMIGNTDWKVLNQHNMKILRVMDIRKIFAVAYDFDYSGFVGTHYSVPHESLSIKSVKDRLYLGPCMSQDEMIACRDRFLTNKEAVFTLIDTTSGMGERSQKSCRKYIEDFYETLESDRSCKKIFACP